MLRPVLLILLFAASAWCAAAEPQVNSDPKSTAKAFAQALVAGDADAAKKLFTGTDPSQQLIEPMAAVAPAFKALSQAATTKYGEEAKRLFTKSPSDKLLEKIETGEVVVDGNEAIVIRAGSSKEDPIRLRRSEQGWRIHKLPDALVKNLPEIRASAQAMQSVASGIGAGDYPTPKAAIEAVRTKARDFAAALATTQPATTVRADGR
jgi:hypothetical protein